MANSGVRKKQIILRVTVERQANSMGDIHRKDLHFETSIAGVTKSCMGF